MLIDKLIKSEKGAEREFDFHGILKNSPSFFVGRETTKQINGLCKFINYKDAIPLAIPPFKTCFYEIETEVVGRAGESVPNIGEVCKTGMLVMQEQGMARVFFFLVRGNEYQLLTQEKIIFNFDDANYFIFPESKGSSARFYLALSILYCVNCPNLIKSEPSDIEKLNKKRKRFGRAPLKEYTIITLNLNKEEKESLRGGSGHCKRSHLRRGHFRNLPDKVVWVRNCVVGSGEKVKQSYIIKSTNTDC